MKHFDTVNEAYKFLIEVIGRAQRGTQPPPGTVEHEQFFLSAKCALAFLKGYADGLDSGSESAVMLLSEAREKNIVPRDNETLEAFKKRIQKGNP